MELNFLGNKYTTCNEPKEKTVVQLKYMGKAYQASMSNASRAVTALSITWTVSYAATSSGCLRIRFGRCWYSRSWIIQFLKRTSPEACLTFDALEASRQR